MKILRINPLEKPVQRTLTLPGSLSFTIRALILSSMVKGAVKLINPLKSDDTLALITALKSLGIKIEEGDDYIIVKGSKEDIEDKQYKLNIKLSGRSARMLLGLLCIVPGKKILNCEENFKKRPVKDLVDCLRELGADIQYLEKDEHLPLKINSSKLSSGTIKMSGNISSQYFSSIMMIAPFVGEIKIIAAGKQVSKSFIDITIDIMNKFGVKVINKNYKSYLIPKNQGYKNLKEYFIESDATSASYFFAIAALTKSRIKILNLSPASTQGDIRFVDILKTMGSKVIKNNKEKWIEVEGTNQFNPINIDMTDNPDIVQTLAIVALFAKGKSMLTGLEHLKVKETNRLKALDSELRKTSAGVYATGNSLIVTGREINGAQIKTYGDHRMAMAFAVLGTKIPGVTIENPEVVNKSFPGFWKTLEGITKIYEN